MPLPSFPTTPQPDFSWLQYDCGFHGYITCSGCGPDTPHYANDVQTPCGTKITALFDGTVTTAGCTAWGYQLFITMDNGMQYYYYHLKSINVSIGQYVRAGEFVGYSGGDPTDPNQACVPQSRWTNGCHTHVGFFTGFKNGVPYGPDITPNLSAMRQAMGYPICGSTKPSNGIPIGASGSLVASVLPNGAQAAYSAITDTSPITNLFIFLDDVVQIINPFDVQPHYALGGIGGILDPVDAAWQVSLNIVADFVAFIIRFIMLMVGIYILIKLVNELLNITGKLQFGARTAATGIKTAGILGLL